MILKIKNYISIVLFMAIFINNHSYTCYASDVTNTIKIKINLIEPKNDIYIMEVFFTNISNKSMEIYKWDLPWISNRNLSLLAISLGGSHKSLKRYSEISDPDSTTIVIKPNKTLSGKIFLDRRFPALPKALEKNDVIIYWTYKALLSKQLKNEQTQGGWFVIKKKVANIEQ